MEYLKIIGRQLFTPIFLIVASLSITLLALGERQDAVFVISAISFNMTIGIIQEIRARHKLKQLELMSAPKAKLIANGKINEVDYKSLSKDDLILLESGDEVPADVVIVKNSSIECDESMLTGESVAVKKQVNDNLFASSIIVAGSAEARVVAVGVDTKVGMMAEKLKNYDPQITPLQKSIFKSIQYFTGLAVLLAILFSVVYGARQVSLIEVIKTITTAAVTVVPEGLLLASTVFLAYGSLRLAQAKVLPQKLSAIEGMALLDVLCVDKTGTLTSPEINFNSLNIFNKTISKRKLTKLLGILARESGTNNSTSQALAEVFSPPFDYDVSDNLPFSSSRKMSAVKARMFFNYYSIAMGAPEYLSKITKLNKQQKTMVAKMARQGLRVLLVVELPFDKPLSEIDQLVARPLALISFNNELRYGVKETVDFLQKNKVSIKVISGDNPETVAYIAHQAGIKSADKFITGVELATLEVDLDKWIETVLNTTIFARVLPEQKEKIVTTFQKQGLYVGMVGDGVNDALALKTADLGVAMGAGATASKRVSDLILLDNAFTALPVGMKLGNRIMLSIEMVACLAFHKIFFGIGLTILTLMSNLPYPFLPRHLTFMNIFLLTLPTIIITIFTPTPTMRINPRYFWKDTLLRILPISALSSLGIFLPYLAMHVLAQHGIVLQGRSTVAVLTATLFGMYVVYLTSLMFRTKQTRYSKLAFSAYLISSLIIVTLSFGWRFARNFFNFNIPNTTGALIAVASVVIVVIIQLQVAMTHKISERS